MDPTHDDSERLGADPADTADALLIDVRRAPAFAQARHMLPGAQRRDPDAIADWSRTLEPGRPVIVYCVHGHEVSRSAAQQLCALGLPARFLRGGISAWEAAGRPLVDKP
jgi:Fe-Mn family superoxide dismutase